MILYVDSSALAKLYVAESHDRYVEGLLGEVGRPGVGVVAVSVITYPEVSAALAAMSRAGRITLDHHERATTKLRSDLSRLFHVRPVTGSVVERAAALPAPVLGVPGKYRLKGYDAVQLATALDMRDELLERARRSIDPREVEPGQPVEFYPEDLLVLSFDDRLHDAAVAEGIAHARPNRAGGRTFPAP